MSWLNSPKRLFRLIVLFVFSSAFLLIFLPSFYSSSRTETASDAFSDEDVALDLDHTTSVFSFNTAWDEQTNPWVLKNSIFNTTNNSFLEKLTSYTIEGHNYDTLFNKQPAATQHTQVTIVVPIYTKEAFSKLNIIASWSAVEVAFQVLIACPSQFKPQIEDKLDKNKFGIMAMDRAAITASATGSTFASGTAGAAIWLQMLTEKDITTDYLYVVDENVPISPYTLHELAYLFRAKQRNDYQDALIGTRGYAISPKLVSDNFCLPIDNQLPLNVSQPVDMVLGAWLLHKSWLPHVMSDMSLESLQLPLGYYLSINLKQQLNKPTIFLPSADRHTNLNKLYCEKVKEEWTKNTFWKDSVAKNKYPTALQYRFMSEHSAMIVADGAKQLVSLYPLLCRFKKYPVHLAILGDDLKREIVEHALTETNCQHHVQLHDFSSMKDLKDVSSMASFVSAVQPRILIQIKPAEQSNMLKYNMIQAMGESHQMAAIGLPEKEIPHALWISDLSLEALSYWNKVQIKLVVITDRRPHSLSRLLQSASKSIYLGDRADLVVNMEQSSDRVTRLLVNSLMWRQGTKTIRHRIRKGGLMPAIVESWYPTNNDEYAVLLEDDIEVSPLFYVWSKYAILKYRYSGNSEAHRLMYGISLYAPRNLELLPAGRVTFDPNSVLLPAGYPEHVPYASQVPCSWGGVYFPEHWREFHAYLVTRLKDLELPKDHQVRLISVPGSRSDKWKKSWKKYFIELVYLRGYVMLYPNFQSFEAFSTNHVEFGTHVKSEKRQSVIGTFMVPLMQRDTILSQLPNQSLPLFENLPVLDLWGQLQTYDSLEEQGSKYHQHVSTCERTYGTFDPQEFFCRVDGPPDPLQEFPSAPKKPKPPVLVKDAVQPIRYNRVFEYTREEEEQGRNELLEFGPKPIDVAQLPTVEERFNNRDDEVLDLESDLDTLNRLYLKLNPENLGFLEEERLAMEEEEEDEDIDEGDEIVEDGM